VALAANLDSSRLLALAHIRRLWEEDEDESKALNELETFCEAFDNYHKAFTWVREAALKGSNDALVILGVVYEWDDVQLSNWEDVDVPSLLALPNLLSNGLNGQQQAAQMANKYSLPFDYVFTSSEDRSIETAKKFGRPTVLKGLDAWYRGADDGRPPNSVKAATLDLILNPDKKPPGLSPIDGKPGESFNEFLRPLMAVMRVLGKEVPSNKRALIVASARNLQVIDRMVVSQFARNPSRQDYERIAQTPNWTTTGELFKLGNDGIEKVDDNKEAGHYFCDLRWYPSSPSGRFRPLRPFLHLLSRNVSACRDHPVGPGHKSEVQTAAWRAMRSWIEEVKPYYERLISIPYMETMTRNFVATQYIYFLGDLADSTISCDQYPAAKKLLLEARAHLIDGSNEARQCIERNLNKLEGTENELRQVFDPDIWEDWMPMADKTTRSDDRVRLRLKWPMY
jgi:Histidine phosphatase superfamily (branch 1)